MPYLTEKDLQELKERLEKEAGELEAQLKAAGKMPEFGSDVESDFSGEEADEAEEYAQNLGLQDALKERLRNIELALEKINKGEYGKCEKCGHDIPLEVLSVNPESMFCKSCKIIHN